MLQQSAYKATGLPEPRFSLDRRHEFGKHRVHNRLFGSFECEMCQLANVRLICNLKWHQQALKDMPKTAKEGLWQQAMGCEPATTGYSQWWRWLVQQ
jgi:hypothetical protein